MKEQIFVLKDIKNTSKIEHGAFHNGIVDICNTIKESCPLPIKLIDFEQPIRGTKIIHTNQLNELNYDLFFSIEVEDLTRSSGDFLYFNFFKEIYGMFYLEDITLLNPFYKNDPAYSEKINNRILWKENDDILEIQTNMKEKIEEIFNGPISEEEKEDILDRIIIKTTVPYYIDEQVNEEDIETLNLIRKTSAEFYRIINDLRDEYQIYFNDNFNDPELSKIERCELYLENCIKFYGLDKIEKDTPFKELISIHKAFMIFYRAYLNSKTLHSSFKNKKRISEVGRIITNILVKVKDMNDTK